MRVYTIHIAIARGTYEMQPSLLSDDQLADILLRLTVDRLLTFFVFLLFLEQEQREVDRLGAALAA